MALFPQVVQFRGKLLDFIFPRRCFGCGKEGDYICATCRSTILRIEPPLCPKCGLPQPSESLCPVCSHRETAIDGIRSPFHFTGTIRQAVHQLKYQNLRAAAGMLAGLMSEYLKSNPVPGETLVPVPLHPKRLKERGYNQSELLARELSKLTGLALMTDCLVRKLQTPPQARTAALEERRRNVKGAFACVDEKVRGKSIILIDDVATSGATLDAAAEALKSHGAAAVWGLTLARET